MRLRPLLLPAIAAAALTLSGVLTLRPHVQPALASTPRATSGPAVALLVTKPGADHTSLYLTHPADTSPPAPVATFTHIEHAAVKGAVVPGTDVVLAAADTVPARDLSFAGSLFRLAPHRPPELLFDRVVHASRPLITAAGRAFVSRGKAGPALPSAMRVDELTVDEIDPSTGATRTVHAMSGYLLFLAGAAGHEILLYRVGPGGADLVAVDPDTGATRTILATMLPFARDFSIDGGTIVFQERDDQDSHTWSIERVDLASGARTRLHAGPSMSLAPFAWPGGRVIFSPDSQKGVDLVQALAPDGSWIAGLHSVAGSLPQAFVMDRGGATAALPTPAGSQLAVAGFVKEGAQ